MSTDQYTPTDDEAREDFAYPWEGFEQNRPARLAAYDRWLASHDARVKAEALREAARDLDSKPLPARTGLPVMLRADWLRARADQIEEEAP